MTDEDAKPGYVIDIKALPDRWPTNRHEPQFWEELGRTVATFGFLEDTLLRAVFALAFTRKYEEHEIDAAFKKWAPKLDKAKSDELGSLITKFEEAHTDHDDARLGNFQGLIEDLNEARKIRNVLCHGSWQSPDSQGKSRPFFINRAGEIYSHDIDVAYLRQIQEATARLCVHVINTVTMMGWRFPGVAGTGEPIWK